MRTSRSPLHMAGSCMHRLAKGLLRPVPVSWQQGQVVGGTEWGGRGMGGVGEWGGGKQEVEGGGEELYPDGILTEAQGK